MTARESLLAEAAKRILITDGAFGTEIQGWKLSEADYAGTLGLAKEQKGNNDILALTKPEVPESIHRAYFAAGADIAETNTFSANRITEVFHLLDPWPATERLGCSLYQSLSQRGPEHLAAYTHVGCEAAFRRSRPLDRIAPAPLNIATALHAEAMS